MVKRKVTVSRREMGADLSVPPRPIKQAKTLIAEPNKQSAPQIDQLPQTQEPRPSSISIAPKPAKEINVEPPTITPFLPPQLDQYLSPYASSTPPKAQPTNVTLAAISEKVSRILAPVHALGLKQINNLSQPQPEATEPVVERDVVAMAPLPRPEVIPPPINPNAARIGGRRGRGPRRRGSPIASGIIKVESSVPNIPTTPTSSRSRGTGRGGRPRASRGGRGSARGTARGGKRKRVEGGEGGNETDSSEEVTSLPTQSRSGRKIFQAAHGTPTIKIDDTGLAPSPTAGKTSNHKGSAKKTSPSTRTPGGASAVCKNCGRGHSPVSNAIVFCDGCNKPWHMFCHDPPIKPEIVRIAEKEWFCSDCTVMREERAKLEGRVPGESMSLFEVRYVELFQLEAYTDIHNRKENTYKVCKRGIWSPSYFTHVRYILTYQSFHPKILSWRRMLAASWARGKNNTRKIMCFRTRKQGMESGYDPRVRIWRFCWTMIP